MEIRFRTDDDSPPYLHQFVFTKSDEFVSIEVVDYRDGQKCHAAVPINDFREAMGALGIVKVISV